MSFSKYMCPTQVWQHLPNDREDFLKAEQAFFDEVTQTSGKLFPFPKDERKAQAVRILKNIHVPRKVTTPDLEQCPFHTCRATKRLHFTSLNTCVCIDLVLCFLHAQITACMESVSPAVHLCRLCCLPLVTGNEWWLLRTMVHNVPFYTEVWCG